MEPKIAKETFIDWLFAQRCNGQLQPNVIKLLHNHQLRFSLWNKMDFRCEIDIESRILIDFLFPSPVDIAFSQTIYAAGWRKLRNASLPLHAT